MFLTERSFYKNMIYNVNLRIIHFARFDDTDVYILYRKYGRNTYLATDSDVGGHDGQSLNTDMIPMDTAI